jgi:hypothetical protein
MDEISSIVQNYQVTMRNELTVSLIKQRAQADQALADMLAEQTQAAAQVIGQTAAGISLYV